MREMGVWNDRRRLGYVVGVLGVCDAELDVLRGIDEYLAGCITMEEMMLRGVLIWHGETICTQILLANETSSGRLAYKSPIVRLVYSHSINEH